MTTFLTVFPECTDMHLGKDIGMIPYHMSKLGYDSFILTYNNDAYNRLQSDLPGMGVIILPHTLPGPLESVLKRYSQLIDLWNHMLHNARWYDIVELYHMSPNTLLTAWLYKALNPRGIVHIKLDGTLTKPAMKTYDFLTIESKSKYEDAVKMYPDIKILPNGIDLEKLPAPIPYDEKPKLIVHSGRLGDHLKASEIVLNVFIWIAKDYPEYKLALIGPMTPEFKEYCQAKIKEHDLGERVIMPGYVSDMQRLYNYYNQAKFVFMPSRSESWCLTLLECMSLGAVPITSNIPIFKELCADAGMYCMVDDEACFENGLRYLLSHDECMIDHSERSMRLARKYNWKNIALQLDALIKEHQQ